MWDSVNSVVAGISVTGLIYCTALTAFRFVTFELDSIAEAVQDFSMFSACSGASVFALHWGHPAAPAVSYSAAAASAALIWRVYSKHVSGVVAQPTDLAGKVFIVTGCNTGIGYETAKQLLEMNGTVVMACRSIDKASAAKSSLLDSVKACSTSKIIVLKLDLCSFESVRSFVKEFHDLGLPLHGLINNAGLMMGERTETKDGHEMMLTANHLSHFLLTNLLLKDILATSGRIVNVSSHLHKLPSKGFNFDDVMAKKGYEMFAVYGQSKLANVLFTKELQRRLSSSVACYAVHPGIVRTEVTRNMNAFMRIGNMLAAPVMRWFQKTPREGAYCSVYCATSPELIDHDLKVDLDNNDHNNSNNDRRDNTNNNSINNSNNNSNNSSNGRKNSNVSGVRERNNRVRYKHLGAYFAHCRAVTASPAAMDEAAAKKLWAISAEITGLGST